MARVAADDPKTMAYTRFLLNVFVDTCSDQVSAPDRSDASRRRRRHAR